MTNFILRKTALAGAATVWLMAAALPFPARAQWAVCTSQSGSYCLPTGNVGVGTNSPVAKLAVQGTAAEVLIQNDATNTLGLGGFANGRQYIKSINLGTALTPLEIQAAPVIVTNPYAQAYSLIIQNSAGKADNGSYTGLQVQTGDASNPLIASLALFTSPTAGNRYLSLGAFDGGVGWANTLLQGNVGIGTPNPGTKLEVYGGNATISQNAGTAAELAINQIGIRSWHLRNVAASGDLRFNDGGGDYLTIQKSTGNVGIGTTVPQSALAVNGVITTKEVVVTATGWADYVFAPGFRPAPLSEVAAYISENHRLPGIPSASEAAEKGVGLGAMQVKLLAKIEELTLHVIEAEKANRELQERIEKLESANPFAPVQ